MSGLKYRSGQKRPLLSPNLASMCITYRPEARRRGVATILMRYIEQRAISEGIDEIVLDTWTANIDAQKFFSSQGYVPFNVIHRKKLVGVS